jgi:hypothetical protein
MAEPLKNYYGPDVPARIASMIKKADSAPFTVELANEGSTTKRLLVELRGAFRQVERQAQPEGLRAEGARTTAARVCAAHEDISLAQHTTRAHYPGQHRVEVMVNGLASGAGAFAVVA